MDCTKAWYLFISDFMPAIGVSRMSCAQGSPDSEPGQRARGLAAQALASPTPPPASHPCVASVAGRRRRSEESARAASPRWAGSTGGPARGSAASCGACARDPDVLHWDLDPLDPSAGSGPRAPRMRRLTSVRLVRDTSVDHSGRLTGWVGCLCAAQGIQALLSHRHPLQPGQRAHLPCRYSGAWVRGCARTHPGSA
jgi:hypothetical protein